VNAAGYPPWMETVSERVEIDIAADAPGVPLVRHALRGLLSGLEVDDDVVADIALAVTEACTNAVVHAYPAGDGTINVTAAHVGDSLAVTVRDHGGGMSPRVDTPGLGVGLPVIAAIAQSVEIGSPEGGGTEVRMRFALEGAAE
jgi:anti-sigma regulatory factor (Ser/Thr protein kinase)